MNLDNGVCGPEGCEVNGVSDHGHSTFTYVTVVTTVLMFLTGILLWKTILKNL